MAIFLAASSTFALAFVLVSICALAGRDTATLAALGAVQGRRGSVLVATAICGIGTVVLATWAGATLAPIIDPAARTALACLAAALAAMELLSVPLPRPLREPTHSTGALSFALVVQQLTGAARWLLAAIVLATGKSVSAGLVGALAVTLVSALAWGLPDRFTHERLGSVRRLAAFLLLVSAAALAIWSARIL